MEGPTWVQRLSTHSAAPFTSSLLPDLLLLLPQMVLMDFLSLSNSSVASFFTLQMHQPSLRTFACSIRHMGLVTSRWTCISQDLRA